VTPKRQWRFYKTDTGHEIARQDLNALPESAKAGVAELMTRYRTDPSKVLQREISQYKGGIYALKYSESHNEYRCYFAREARGGYMLLALSFVTKRENRPNLAVPASRLKDWQTRGAAVRRLKEWQARHGQ